jgi:hypothetical protein
MRRRPAAIVVALFLAALAPACGSSPAEGVGTTSESVMLVNCPVGEHAYCDMNELTGRMFCTCYQNTCSYQAPAPPWYGSVAWIAAWASPMVGGTCPVIKTSTGRWAEIGDVLGPTDSNYMESVPGDSATTPLKPGDCTQVPGMGPSCCTYVWWPNDYPSADDTSLPKQDTADLCPVNGATLVPIEQLPCDPASGHRCDQPSSGGCGSCTPVQPP